MNGGRTTVEIPPRTNSYQVDDGHNDSWGDNGDNIQSEILKGLWLTHDSRNGVDTHWHSFMDCKAGFNVNNYLDCFKRAY
jgi:hypothetical protein